MPNIGGISIAPMNMGALIQAAQPSPLMQILHGAQAGVQDYEQLQQQKQYAQELKQRQQQLMVANAQQSWDQIGKMLVGNPAFTKSPAVKAKVAELAQTLGLPTPFAPDGSIDASQWQPTWQEMAKDRDWLDRVSAATPAQKKVLLQGIAGVPPGLEDQGPILSTREQTMIGNMNRLATHEQWSDANIADMMRNRDLLDPARAAYYGLEGHAAVIKAQASQRQADAAMKRANDAVYIAQIRAQAALQRASSRTPAGMSLAKTAVAETQRAVDSAQQQYDAAVSQWRQAMVDNGGDPDHLPSMEERTTDSTIQPLQLKAEGLKAKLDTARQQLQDAQAVLNTQPGYAAPLQAATGKPTTVQNDTSGMPKTMKDPEGKKRYLHADGNYYLTPP